MLPVSLFNTVVLRRRREDALEPVPALDAAAVRAVVRHLNRLPAELALDLGLLRPAEDLRAGTGRTALEELRGGGERGARALGARMRAARRIAAERPGRHLALPPLRPDRDLELARRLCRRGRVLAAATRKEEGDEGSSGDERSHGD